MKRSTHVLLTALGVTVCLLLGSGLVAMTSDTARSTGNRVLSGTYTPPRHDVQIALVAVSSSCATATYVDSAGANFSLGSFNAPNVVLERGEPVADPFWICVKNNGSGAADLSVFLGGVIESETACSPDEAAGGLDSSCGTGVGELASVLEVKFDGGFTTPTSCVNSGAQPWSTFDVPVGAGTLASGGICTFDITLSVDPDASDANLLRAQTDQIDFAINFVLQDVAP